MERYYVGTDLKFALTITSEGFNMDTDPWVATVRCGKKEVKCERANSVIDENGQWYILVDSSVLMAGTYILIVDIDVPDDDFKDGYRHETLKMEQPLAVVNLA